MEKAHDSKANRYALLIGIDCYLPNRLPDGSSYESLRGCVRDVLQMEEFLTRKFALPAEHIFKLTSSNVLTSPNVDARFPPEPQEKWPTYENMVAAFQKMTLSAQPGDHICIHYSGHGGRAKTIFKERKGPQGLDEALVPMDIGNKEARYLRDLELAKLLSDMVNIGLVVFVVLDSCHSGGMTRGGGDVAVRGIETVDTSSRSEESLVAAKEELLQIWDHHAAKSSRSLTAGSGWLPEPEGYALLAACRPSEFAHEYAFDGEGRNGALTYWLLNSLRDLGPELSYKTLHDRILPRVHSQFENQTPQLQGEGDRVFFGIEHLPSVYAIPVMKVDQTQNRVQLGAGQAHGLKEGARFAIYPGGADFTKTELRQSLVELTELDAVTSWASVMRKFGQEQVEQGAQAVLLEPGSVRLVQKVHMVKQDRDNAPPNIDQDAVFQTLAAALQGSGWVEAAKSGERVDYNVALNSGGEYEVWDRTGQLLRNLRPAIKVADKDAARALVNRLVHLAKYNALKQLLNHDATSPLARKLVVDIVGKSKTYKRGELFVAEESFNESGGTPILRPGEWIGLRIKNASSQRLLVAALDMQPDFGVSQFYPKGKGDNFVEFEPGQEAIILLKAGLPEGYTEGKDVVKVFGCKGPTNFRWLELPPLDHPSERHYRSPANSLEEMLAAFTADRPRTRDLTPNVAPSDDWVVTQIEVFIKQDEADERSLDVR